MIPRTLRFLPAFVVTPWLFVGASSGEDEIIPAAEVDSLIAQLGSDSFIQRDFAGRQLMAVGEPVVSRLAELARRNDSECATAAVQLLGRMALGNNASGAAAHRTLVDLLDTPGGIGLRPREAAKAAVREAERHVVGIVTALGGDIERDETLAIVSLQINSERFGDEHARILSRLRHLKRLDLRSTQVSDASLISLASLKELTELNLADTRVTSDGLRQLAPLQRLTKLSLYRIPCSADDVQWIREQFPATDVRY